MQLRRSITHFFYWLTLIILICSCSKSDIQFGTGFANSYIKISRVDTIGINMSTYFPDSFSTTKPSSFLIGKYSDPELGTLAASAFIPLTAPPALQIANDAIFDSITLVLRLNDKYYGDTGKIQTIEVKELAAPIEYTYSSYLFNTSSISEKSPMLGSKTLKIKPTGNDSILIRLNDIKGADLFDKVRRQDERLLTQDAFLNYFKGISVSFSGNESSLILGVHDSICLRLHYHNSIPYPEAHTIDMETYTGGIYFNQIKADRTHTSFASQLTSYPKVILSSITNQNSFIQGMSGVMTKVDFPGLRSFVQSDTTVKLLSAVLVLKAEAGTYDDYKLKLPSQLFLVNTDGSNIMGGALTGTDGSVMYSTPVPDFIYNAPTYYSFDITSWLNSTLLNTSTNDYGLFVLDNYAGDANSPGRAIFSNAEDLTKGSQVILSFLTIK